MIEELAVDHRVIAFDLPAVGDSTGLPASAEKIALADILLGAAETFGAKSPIIAGFDVGGMIAYAAARDHAHRIKGAVVMNTVIPGIEPWSKVLADPRVWHFAFHAIPDLPERLVDGHQLEYFDYFLGMLVARKDRERTPSRRVRRRVSETCVTEGWLRLVSRDERRCRAQCRPQGHRHSDPLSTRRCRRRLARRLRAGVQREGRQVHRNGQAAGER